MKRCSLLLPDIIYEGLRKEAFEKRVSMNSIMLEYLTRRYVMHSAEDQIDPNHFKAVTGQTLPKIPTVYGTDPTEGRMSTIGSPTTLKATPSIDRKSDIPFD